MMIKMILTMTMLLMKELNKDIKMDKKFEEND